MKIGLLHALLVALIFEFSLAGPIETEDAPVHVNKDPLEDLKFEEGYKNYLQEVMKVLKDDEVVSQVMDQDKGDTDSNVENYIKFASQQTRTKLDELKRLELKRLKSLHRLANKVAQAKKRVKPNPEPVVGAEKEKDWHVDQKDPDSFNLADLKLLINKAVKQIAGIDSERHKSFKQYEMKKEHDFRAGIKNVPAAALSETLQKHRDSIVRHKNHSKINYPGGKDQLVEVWNKVDHMDPENFDARIFFLLHDVDRDGMLSIEEIEALLQIELDKIYAAGDPDDDMVERREEMNKMRESVFHEIDSDQDGMVNWSEFLASTKADSFDNRENWKTIDDEPTFTDEEYLQYEALFNSN